MEPAAGENSTELGSPIQTELDDEEQQALSWFQKARDKVANVDWKKLLLVAIVFIGNFFVFCSISLIGAFFPTEVSYTMHAY